MDWRTSRSPEAENYHRGNGYADTTDEAEERKCTLLQILIEKVHRTSSEFAAEPGSAGTWITNARMRRTKNYYPLKKERVKFRPWHADDTVVPIFALRDSE